MGIRKLKVIETTEQIKTLDFMLIEDVYWINVDGPSTEPWGGFFQEMDPFFGNQINYEGNTFVVMRSYSHPMSLNIIRFQGKTNE